MKTTSFGARLVAMVLLTAVVAFASFTLLTIAQLDESLERQARQLATLSEEKLAQRLDGKSKLARARLEALSSNSARRLEGIAQRADVGKAIARANVVEINEVLGRAARQADLDAVLVVDAKLRVFGADRGEVDLVSTNHALRESDLARLIRPLLEENDRRRPRTLRLALAVDASLAGALAGPPAALAFVMVEPVFDDFGDVFGALIGVRRLKVVEETLLEFTQLEGDGVLVLRDGRVVSEAGPADMGIGLEQGTRHLKRTTDGRFWSRCVDYRDQWQVCGLVQLSELNALTDELVRVGAMEGRSLAAWMVLAAVLSIAAFGAVTMLATRHVAGPLVQITDAVRAVARGDWKAFVTGTERPDEIGDIARAVRVLQDSLEERDRLRADVANAESVNRRREALEEAIRRFDRTMRSGLLSVSECAEAIDETVQDLARTSAVAEGEAAEAAFVSEHVGRHVGVVLAAARDLSRALEATAGQVRATADDIKASRIVVDAGTASRAAAAQDAEGLMTLLSDVTAKANVTALNAAVQIARSEPSPTVTSLVNDLRQLADRLSEAESEFAQRVMTVQDEADHSMGTVAAVTEALAEVVSGADGLIRRVEDQDREAQRILDGMGQASESAGNVSSSIERLRTTIEQTRNASVKVVRQATDMADEARRLDTLVKAFLREVAA
ncbi:MAG TPA: HAMP domain-containing protein [Beijerinckiaceae bacterium]